MDIGAAAWCEDCGGGNISYVELFGFFSYTNIVIKMEHFKCIRLIYNFGFISTSMLLARDLCGKDNQNTRAYHAHTQWNEMLSHLNNIMLERHLKHEVD